MQANEEEPWLDDPTEACHKVSNISMQKLYVNIEDYRSSQPPSTCEIGCEVASSNSGIAICFMSVEQSICLLREKQL